MEAERLAHFADWMHQNFGSTSEAFLALDRWNKKSVQKEEFLEVVADLGFNSPAKLLFLGLDKDSKKFLVEEDLQFLDRWKPPLYLLSQPNWAAVDLFKAALINKYRSYLKAWRRVLDTDNSNRCDWQEFQVACRKHLFFTGDIPGAWRALDKDLRGFITLAQIDPVSCMALKNFKDWATTEFGSVKSAFSVFDLQHDRIVTAFEWKRACSIYNFHGNATEIFRALDVDRANALTIDQVIFLDDFDVDELDHHTHRTSQTSHTIHELDATINMDTTIRVDDQAWPSQPSTSVVLKPDAPQKGRLRKYAGRTIMTIPDRNWWHNQPCSWPTSTRKIRSSRGNSMWCGRCKIRGFCSHVREHAQRLVQSDPLATPRTRSVTPSRSARGCSPPASSRSRASTSMSLCRPHVTETSAQSPRTPPGSARLPQAKFASRHLSSVGYGGPDAADAEVQISALRHFPMGTVTPEQATLSLRMLASNVEALSLF